VCFGLTACTFDFTSPLSSDGGNIDAQFIGDDSGVVDAVSLDATFVNCSLWQATWIDTCAVDEPGPALTLADTGDYTFNTDTAQLQDPAGELIPVTTLRRQDVTPNVLVLSVLDFEVGSGANLEVSGSLPFAVASWTSILVDGTITVAAGANTGTCNGALTPPEPGSVDTDGGGGGAGAALDGNGGNGGGGDGGANGAIDGGGVAVPTTLRGGCDGGDGGDANKNAGGVGGIGGGALLLAARQDVTVNGNVTAPGQGGRGGIGGGGDGGGGGGGGGSGGMVVVDASSTTVVGGLTANGGGGGEGGDNFYLGGETGEAGRTDATAARGGDIGLVGGGAGGSGGIGSGASRHGKNGLNFQGGAADGGGGGGGGSVGYIFVEGTLVNNGIISPPPQ
jgi:hypothetical protein